MKCCSLLCAQCVAGGWAVGEGLEKVGVPHKKWFFFSGFSSGQGNVRRKEKWVAKRLDTRVLVCHDILFRVVVSFSTRTRVQHPHNTQRYQY